MYLENYRFQEQPSQLKSLVSLCLPKFVGKFSEQAKDLLAGPCAHSQEDPDM